MQRYFIQLSYNGTGYSGWQVQKNSEQTIQQVVNTILSKVLNEPLTVVGCGRTDTGVHALKYFAHFDSEKDNLLDDKEKWLLRLNHTLPKDIAFEDIIKVRNNANARFDAVYRTYEYFIINKKSPFHTNKAFYHYGYLNVDAMNKAAAVLFEFTDFTSFAKTGTDNLHNNCKLYVAQWKQEGDFIIFTIKANRFLRNMVRAIVGTLLKVGKGKMSMDEFRTVIESKDRTKAGLSAHACGLFLTNVEYKKEIFDVE